MHVRCIKIKILSPFRHKTSTDVDTACRYWIPLAIFGNYRSGQWHRSHPIMRFLAVNLNKKTSNKYIKFVELSEGSKQKLITRTTNYFCSEQRSILFCQRIFQYCFFCEQCCYIVARLCLFLGFKFSVGFHRFKGLKNCFTSLFNGNDWCHRFNAFKFQ